MRTSSVLAAIALVLSASCTAPQRAPQGAPERAPQGAPAASVPPEPPLARNQARVEGVRAIGPYLEAQLRGNGGTRGFLFVASEPCRRALTDGAVVRLAAARPLVRISAADGARCSARGLANLAAWRDALPVRRASFLVVTAPAELALVGETPGFLLAAGKLPLATELRWSSPLDLAAVLPDTPACRAHLARGRTEMEFRPRGEDVFLLRGRLEPCPVLAIAEPLLLQ
jgi:hypothetical protein